MRRCIVVLLALSLLGGAARATEMPPPQPIPQEASLVRQSADALIGRPVAALRLGVGVVADCIHQHELNAIDAS